jgi:hypothetical protein
MLRREIQVLGVIGSLNSVIEVTLAKLEFI